MERLHSFFIVFLFLASLYGVLMILWGVNWYRHRYSTGIRLHRYIGFTLLMQCIEMLVLVSYYAVKWNEDPYTIDKEATKSYYLEMAFYVAACIAQPIFYSMLMLIAVGWCIIEKKLSLTKWLGLVVFVLVYFSVELTKVHADINNDYNTLVVMIYCELVLFIMMLVFVVVKTHYNIRKLTLQVKADSEYVTKDPSTPTGDASSVHLSEFSQKSTDTPASPKFSVNGDEDEETPGNDEKATPTGEETTQQRMEEGGQNAVMQSGVPSSIAEMTIPEATEKLKLFQYFYKLFTTYIVLVVLFKYFSTSAIPVICGMYLDFAFICGVCFVFRLRPVNQYFYLVNEE